MPRAFIILMDSFGIGATADAEKYGDAGADTFRHIAEYCFEGKADKEGVRKGPLMIPNLTRLGINEAAAISQGPGISRRLPQLSRGNQYHDARFPRRVCPSPHQFSRRAGGRICRPAPGRPG